VLKRLLASVIATISINAQSTEESTVPVTFNPGDVLTADTLNQVFSRINNVTSGLKQEDLVGNWECSEIRSECLSDSGWSQHSSGLYCSRTQTYTFNDVGDGTLTFSTSKGFPLRSGTSNQEGQIPVSNEAAVLAAGTNILFFNHQYSSTQDVDGKLRVVKTNATSINVGEIAQANSGLCVKQNQAPSAPTNLISTLNNAIATLSWTDNSDDESGFIVQTKTDVDDDWADLVTTAADVTEYVTQSLEGNNWFRVVSMNGSGSSIASNVILLQIEGPN